MEGIYCVGYKVGLIVSNQLDQSTLHLRVATCKT